MSTPVHKLNMESRLYRMTDPLLYAYIVLPYLVHSYRVLTGFAVLTSILQDAFFGTGVDKLGLYATD